MLINILGFNISWFGLVSFGDRFIPIAIIFLLIHMIFLSKNNKELLFIIAVCAIGTLVDSSLQYFNVFIFQDKNIIPFWLVILWGCFAATLFHSLRFLGRNIGFQIAAGLFAPLSYIAGNQFSAVAFGQSLLITYVILGLIWPLLFMFFFYLKTHFFSEGVNYA